PYYMLNVRGNISGPIGKKTSYFATFRYNDHQNNSVINALLTEDATNPFRKIVPSPDTSVDFSVRLDRQMSKNNVLTARWDFQHCGLHNGGLSGSVACFTGDTPPQDAVSSQVLPSQAFNGGTNTSTVQLTDSQNLGKSMVIETRFQWIRSRSTQDPVSTAGTVNVSGYFNGGGSAMQMLSDHTDNIEFQEFFSLERGQHFFRAGARYRGVRDANFSNANFNGVATYSAYKPAAGSGGTSATALANYTAGTPSKFVANVGSPHATLYTGDLALFVEDEYRVRKNVTLNYGMRLEMQSAIPDHVNPAPRLSAAWDVGKTAKQQAYVTLRVGFGLFYDRFQSGNLLTSIRQQAGGLQQQYVFTLSGNTPVQCYAGPMPMCGGVTAAITPYSVSPKLRSQYDVIEGLTAEKVMKFGRISVNYQHQQGVHQWVSRNINAPLPGTYTPGVPNSGVRPLGGTGNVYEFDSNGAHTTDLLFGDAQLSLGRHVNFWFYTNGRIRATADSQGAASFPTSQYNLKQDNGRVSVPTFRLFTGASVDLPWGIFLTP
ncbi:MAG: hypothetical protein ABI205_01590, partial [Gemmatimonadaceae bacterium]